MSFAVGPKKLPLQRQVSLSCYLEKGAPVWASKTDKIPVLTPLRKKERIDAFAEIVAPVG